MAGFHRSRCELLERRLHFAAGGLDPSFGVNGVATANVGGALTANAVAVQLDGKTVVVGYSADKQFAVARYNVDGSLDTTFGPTFNGTVLTSFGRDTFAHAVAIQDDGKIVVAGGANDGADVARYNPDGTLDLSFDGDGKTNFEFGFFADHAVATSVVMLPRQSLDVPERILIGGFVAYGIRTPRDFDFFVVRLNGADGALDDTFGLGDGHVIVDLGELGDDDTLAAMAVDFSGIPATNPHYGAIVAVGTKTFFDSESISKVAILRLTAGGLVDPSFDGDGTALVTIAQDVHSAATGLVIQSDGKYVVGGTTGQIGGTGNRHDFAMARFLPSGPLDPSFGTADSGWVRTDMGGIERGTDLTRSFDGGLILGGTSETGPVGQPTVTRKAFAAYTADGILDPRFDGDGRWTMSVGVGGQFANGPGRRFVFAGGSGMRTTRFLDVGANLVRAAGFDLLAYELLQDPASFFVYRSENLPVATRVFFDAYGTARAPDRPGRGEVDYGGLSRPLFGSENFYVDIPAGQSFTTVTITPAQDGDAEGNEIASFKLLPDPTYEVGSPSVVSVTIVDFDAPPPGPAEVYVRSSTWAGPDVYPENVTFMEYLKSAGLGHEKYGYRIDDKPAGDVLPWTNIGEIVVRYSSPPVLTGSPAGSTILLDGIRGNYPTIIGELDPQTFVLIVDRPLGGSPATAQTNGDLLHFSLPGGGGYYHYDLRVLQGDADKSGSVVAADFSAVKTKFFRSASNPGTGTTAYSPFYDVDGNGAIVANDFSEVKRRFFHNLPPVGGSPATAVSTRMTSITSDLVNPSKSSRSSRCDCAFP